MSEYLRAYIGSKRDPPSWKEIRFRCAFHNTIYDALKARHFKETDNETDWEIFWADKEWIHDVFDHIHLRSPNQRINHFRNHYELTRKDLLVKNVKRSKRQAEKEGNTEEARLFGMISPQTFVLPQEYSIFVEEFKKYSHDTYWIMKPVGKSQGKGIFLFNQLKQISDWKPNETTWASRNETNKKKQDDEPEEKKEAYVVQKYLQNPLLIGGKKFDIRIYVLVTSFSPLVIYLYRSGFARFSCDRFTMNAAEISNNTVHLTNVAIQKHSDNYDEKRGGKWNLAHLKKYLITVYGYTAVDKMFTEMQDLVIASCLSVQKVMIQDKHCFELYGYDIIVDNDLQPWILEVNASPSLTANTPDDYQLKFGLLDDTITILDFEKYLTGQEEHIGGFDVVYRNGQKVTPPPSAQFHTYLGCANTRIEDLRRLASSLQRNQCPPEPLGFTGSLDLGQGPQKKKGTRRKPNNNSTADEDAADNEKNPGDAVTGRRRRPLQLNVTAAQERNEKFQPLPTQTNEKERIEREKITQALNERVERLERNVSQKRDELTNIFIEKDKLDEVSGESELKIETTRLRRQLIQKDNNGITAGTATVSTAGSTVHYKPEFNHSGSTTTGDESLSTGTSSGGNNVPIVSVTGLGATGAATHGRRRTNQSSEKPAVSSSPSVAQQRSQATSHSSTQDHSVDIGSNIKHVSPQKNMMGNFAPVMGAGAAILHVNSEQKHRRHGSISNMVRNSVAPAVQGRTSNINNSGPGRRGLVNRVSDDKGNRERTPLGVRPFLANEEISGLWQRRGSRS